MKINPNQRYPRLFTIMLLSACLLFLLNAAWISAAEYATRNLKIQAPRFLGTIGEKMTASGGVVVTSEEITLHAGTVTWLFAPKQGAVQSLEANGKVSFHLTQTSKDGSTVVMDGEGDSLVYNMQEGKATVSSDKAAPKARVHAVETIPATPAAGGQAASQAAARSYDIRALRINLDLKERTFDASGEVEVDANLPEKPSTEAAAK